MRKIFAFLNSIFLAGCSLFGIQSEEKPVYGLLESSGNFEIRSYQAYLVAQTEDSGTYDDATGKSFFRLFDYISGKNRGQQKISMTSPVQQESKREKISMTAPVFQVQSGQTWVMRFVLPAQFDLTSAPKPDDHRVKILEVSAKKVAVLKFSGFYNASAIAEKKMELLEWLKEKNIKVISQPRSAGYNPPWTIPFLRRNEIQIDIE
jgi:hypothetical protein